MKGFAAYKRYGISMLMMMMMMIICVGFSEANQWTSNQGGKTEG